MANEIDWNLFEGNYMGLETEEMKTAVLTNWQTVEKEFGEDKSIGLSFDVVEENGKTVWEEDEHKRKKFDTTSRRLIKKLKHIIQTAIAHNVTSIKVQITRVGEKFDTQYMVKALPLETEAKK